jgi:hypothetical protein
MKVWGSHDETAEGKNQSRRNAEGDSPGSNGSLSPLDY